MYRALMILAAMAVLVAGCSRDPVNEGVVTHLSATPSPRAYMVVVESSLSDQADVVVCESMRRLNAEPKGFMASDGSFRFAVSLPPLGGGKYRATILAPNGEDGALLLTEAGDLIASDNIHLFKVEAGCCGIGLSCGEAYALL